MTKKVEHYKMPRHGHAPAAKRSLTYGSWQSMVDRCVNPNCPEYPKYAGKLCQRWKSFPNFLADMGERPLGTSIDRWPNGAGNYEPGNCRWAMRRQQNLNTKRNINLTIGGTTKTTVEWGEQNGIPLQTVWARIYKYGWKPERAVMEPPAMSGRSRALKQLRLETAQ